MKLNKILNVIGGLCGAMIICLVSDKILGDFVGHGISFLFFPINFILAKAIFEDSRGATQ